MSQGTTKGSGTMIDAEVFGGVVTNIEKLLTPRQKKRLNHNIMKRA